MKIKKCMLYLLGVMICLILSSSNGIAYGPNTHVFITKPIFDAQDTPIAQLCQGYERQFYAGLMIPDITILKYFENYPMGEVYRVTHNWNFIERGFENAGDDIELKCMWYGAAVHEIEDTTPHNRQIPEGIREKNIPNILYHPIKEGIVEAHVISNYPEITYLTTHSMDILFEEGNEKYLDSVQQAIGSTTEFDAREAAYDLSTKLGSFYTSAYTPSEENRFSWLWHTLASIITPLTEISDCEQWLDQTRKETRAVFNNWGLRLDASVTPHGSDAIASADFLPLLLWISIPFLIIIAFYLWILRRIKFIRNIEEKIVNLVKSRRL